MRYNIIAIIFFTILLLGASLKETNVYFGTGLQSHLGNSLSPFANPSSSFTDLSIPEHHTIWIISPENYSYTTKNNDTLAFIFNHTGYLTGVVNCTLFLDGAAVGYTENVSPDTNTGVYSNASITEATHNWWVNCTNGTLSESSTELWGHGNYTFTIDTTPPTSYSPSDNSTPQWSLYKINWTLYDNFAPRYYTVFRNGTIQNQTAAWTNNTNLNIWVNTTQIGDWNYTINFNDYSGNNGTPDEVLITVTADTESPAWSQNKTNATETKTQEYAGFNITLSDNAAGGYQIFSFNNGTSWSNDTAQAWSSGQELQKAKLITATRGQTIQWYWWFNDKSGNNQTTDIWQATVANTAPTQPVLTYANNSANKSQPTLKWTNGTDADSDPLTHTVYISNQSDFAYINQSSVESDGNYTTLGLTEGTWYWKVNASDSFAETSSETRQFAIDTEEPYVEIILPKSETYSSTLINLNYTASDNIHLQACWYVYNSITTEIICLVNTSFTALDNQQSVLTLYVNDSAGNINSTSVTFGVDTLHPQIYFSIGTETNDTYLNRNWIYANVSITDTNFKNLTFYLYNTTALVNETTYTDSTRHINWTGLPETSYWFNASSFDDVGNQNSTRTINVTIDTTPPATVTNLQNQSNTDAWIYWNWTNPSDPDFNHTEIYLNSTGKINTSNNYYNATSLNASTWYGLQVRTVDSAGNINQTWVNATAKTSPDTTPPIITIIAPTNTSSLSAGTTSIAINITTNENAVCRYNTTNSNYTNSTNFTTTGSQNHSFTFTGLTNGNTYNIYYWCNDTNGNVNQNATYHTFSVSTAASPPPDNPPSGSSRSSDGFITAPTVVENTTTEPVTNDTNETENITENITDMKSMAKEALDRIMANLTDKDIEAKVVLDKAQLAFEAGDYDNAYSMALDAEKIMGEERQAAGYGKYYPYAIYAILLAAIGAAAYAARKKGIFNFYRYRRNAHEENREDPASSVPCRKARISKSMRIQRPFSKEYPETRPVQQPGSVEPTANIDAKIDNLKEKIRALRKKIEGW